MRLLLIFLSSLVFTCAFAQTNDTQDEVAAINKCSVVIQTKKASISGILITRESSDAIIGSVINEFGISVMDFKYSKSNSKLKLTHVVSFLNKWYIKRVLSADLKYCIHILNDIPVTNKNKYIVEQNDDVTTVFNKKRNITYKFSSLNAELTDEAD